MGRPVEGQGARPCAAQAVTRPALLDSSFLIALERETASGRPGPATAVLPLLRGRRLVVSVVTVEELLEGAADEEATAPTLQRFDADVVGSDRRAFERLGA